jgi:hypothetical protein
MANLTAEQLAMLQQASGPVLINGTWYQPNQAQAISRENGDAGPVNGYLSYADADNKVGGTFNQYDTAGNFTGTGVQQKVDATGDLLKMLAAAGLMYGFLPGTEGFGGAATGATGTMNALPLESLADIGGGNLLMSEAGAGLSGAGLAAGAAGAAGGAAGGMGGGLSGGATAGGIAGATIPSVTNAVPAVTGGLTNLLNGSGGLLGTGATILGALAGGQGTDNTTTSQKSLPDYLQGPVVNDLIPRAQGLLAQQMPIAAQQGAQLRQVGSGLLNTPMRGNGFSLFTGR